jgi:uncharacterized protein
MGTVGWLLVVAVAIALGFSAGRLWPGLKTKISELERERDAARDDLRSYRQEVDGHFARTAELFDKVTADYRGLYEHLALGARQLGSIRSESVAVPLAEPEQRRLARSGPGTAAREPYVGDEHQPAQEQKPPPPATENTSDEYKNSADDTVDDTVGDTADGAPEPAMTARALADEKPAELSVKPLHAQPANDEQVRPREATTGR